MHYTSLYYEWSDETVAKQADATDEMRTMPNRMMGSLDANLDDKVQRVELRGRVEKAIGPNWAAVDVNKDDVLDRSELNGAMKYLTPIMRTSRRQSRRASIGHGRQTPACSDAIGRDAVKTSLIAMMALAGAGLLCPPAVAQAAPGFQTPKTSWGAPDLTGFWNQHLADVDAATGRRGKAGLDEKEADQLTRRNVYSAAEREEAGASKLDEASSKELLSDGNASRAYNRYWMDPGTSYAQVKGEYRSSWITYPNDGRIPYIRGGHPSEHAHQLVR